MGVVPVEDPGPGKRKLIGNKARRPKKQANVW
jgi:hypothetical protein